MSISALKSSFYPNLTTRLPYIVKFTKCYSNMSGAPIETSIRSKLSQTLRPSYLDVINESANHNVPAGSETHFKVVVVTDQFENQPLLTRHRMINTILSEELENGVHALSIVAKTPQQWEESDKKVTPSPNCRGGFGK
ncbi:hypothetical protein O3M35_008639 [Rhynocoris fuscipes]|uniref:BolA-like protein n=1 Tax=Rhynocoris fuscipes TaxID=488301 RepID=A0AAW1D8H3_9HEMI